MPSTTHPSKEQVRQWMAERKERAAPPPSPEEVRRQLGWEMLYNNDPRAGERAR
jgi:hypothetical protein